jgi:FHA domain
MGAPAARLGVVAGKAVGMSILVEDELVIGRHAEDPGRLADDEEISRSHARFTYDATGVCAVEDLGSTNGTFVNGLRISAPQTLMEGDTIEIGGTTLVLRDLPRPDAQPAAPEQDRQPTVRIDTAPHSPAAGADAVEVATPVARAEPGTAADAAPPPPPTLSLRLQIDFAAGEARLSLDDDFVPVRLAFDADAWRSASLPPTEKGGPRER